MNASVRGFAPGGAVGGRVPVPGSKSLAQRALVVASLCGGTTRIAGLPDGDDVARALALVEACGAQVVRLAPPRLVRLAPPALVSLAPPAPLRRVPSAVAIDGRPPGPHRGWRPDAPLEVGESGTLARLATAALALCGHGGRSYLVRAHGSLVRRASAPLLDALRRTGAGIEPEDAAAASAADRWPLVVRPLGPPSDVEIETPVSSQEVSGLMIALAAYPGVSRLHVRGALPSRPYLEMTRGLLADFGVTTHAEIAHGVDPMRDVETFTIEGPLRAPEAPIAIEPDASSAAVAAGAACLSGGSVVVPGLSPRSRQGDVRIVEHLARFGCRARLDDAGLHAEGAPLQGAELDLTGEPDLAPVLAIVAAHAALRVNATSRLAGLGTLRGKESARVEVLAAGLAAVGFEVEGGADFLRVAAPRAGVRGATLDAHGDHRMAFAFALLGLFVEGVLVRGAGSVAKSWPRFWRDLERAGARGVASG